MNPRARSTRSCRRRFWGATLLFCAASAGAASAQTVPWAVGAGAGYESYWFNRSAAGGLERLSLLSIPFAARTPLARRTVLEVGGAYARGEMLRSDSSSAVVEGLTDTELRLIIPLRRDAITLTGVVALPTGHARHTREEAAVAGAIAADLLPFRITHWGTGGAYGVNAAVARTFGSTGVGVSAGYRIGNRFEFLVADERAYRPADELRLRLVLDRAVGQTGKAALQLAMFRYGDDEFAGRNLYRSGDRYQAVATYSFASGNRSSTLLYTGLLHRAEGAFLQFEQEAPAQDLVLAGAGIRLPLRRGTWTPSLDARLFRSDDGVGQGFVTGIGASADWPFGRLTLVPSVRGRFGSVTLREDLRTDLAGVEIGLTTRFGGN